MINVNEPSNPVPRTIALIDAELAKLAALLAKTRVRAEINDYKKKIDELLDERLKTS